MNIPFWHLWVTIYNKLTVSNQVKAGHYQPARETLFKWRYTSGPMVAQQHMLTRKRCSICCSSLSDALTQKLSSTVSMDATALYIQRDRNNDLLSYNEFRQACGLGEFVCLFDLRFYATTNSYGHVETVSSPNHIFLGKLDKAVNQYFVYICLEGGEWP